MTRVVTDATRRRLTEQDAQNQLLSVSSNFSFKRLASFFLFLFSSSLTLSYLHMRTWLQNQNRKLSSSVPIPKVLCDCCECGKGPMDLRVRILSSALAPPW